MQSNKPQMLLASFRLFAVAYVVLAVIGGINGYSPVPFMDMWDGFLGTFTRASAGDFGGWWAQHNEHRIVFARALYWLDETLFRGAGMFLVAANYVLIGLSFVFLYVCLQERLKEERDNFAQTAIGLLIFILMFSWIQQANLVWGFQSQFILAQILPFVAFFLLHRSYVSKAHPVGLFVLACVVAFCALGSMANGVLALPLMTLLAAVLRMGWPRVISLAILAAFSTFVYFHNYQSSSEHGSFTHGFLHDPVGIFRYLLVYVGGPFYGMTGKGSVFITQIAGLFLIGSSVFFALRALKSPKQSSLQLALLTFLLFIGGTALGTAGGRLIFGIEQAATSRYMTPSLMAWSALLILYAPALAWAMKRYPSLVLWLLLLVPISLLPEQIETLRSRSPEFFERRVAALALELGIRDQVQIAFVHPSAQSTLEIAKIASKKNLSIFADPQIKDARELIGQTTYSRSLVACTGRLDGYTRLLGDARYVGVRGWLFEAVSKAAPGTIHILDSDGRVVGHAITGHERLDLEKGGKEAKMSGFKGYLQAEQVGKPIVLRGLIPDCELKVDAPTADSRLGIPALTVLEE